MKKTSQVDDCIVLDSDPDENQSNNGQPNSVALVADECEGIGKSSLTPIIIEGEDEFLLDIYQPVSLLILTLKINFFFNFLSLKMCTFQPELYSQAKNFLKNLEKTNNLEEIINKMKNSAGISRDVQKIFNNYEVRSKHKDYDKKKEHYNYFLVVKKSSKYFVLYVGTGLGPRVKQHFYLADYIYYLIGEGVNIEFESIKIFKS